VHADVHQPCQSATRNSRQVSPPEATAFLKNWIGSSLSPVAAGAASKYPRRWRKKADLPSSSGVSLNPEKR
jgi:hypothetical protein